MLKYVIRRRTALYVSALWRKGNWTREIGCAREFRTKRDALGFLADAGIPQQECDIVRTGWIYSDREMEAASKKPDVRALRVSDPGAGRSTVARPTDQALASIGTMANLEELSIFAGAITDAGLLHLHALTRLRRLELKGTQVTEEGVEALRKVLVACKIRRVPSPRWQYPLSANIGQPQGPPPADQPSADD